MVHFEQHTWVMFEPEPKFWIVASVRNPSASRLKDGKKVIEWKENELDDIALKSIVVHPYKVFRVRFCPYIPTDDNSCSTENWQKLWKIHQKKI